MLEDMTWLEVEEALKKTNSVIVPFGSVEEHGPHLPTSTDSDLCYAIVKKVAEGTNFLVAPIVNYGLCRSTREFPGTVSIGFETLKQLVKDILFELVNQGFSKIVLFSFHAGSTHLMALKEAAFDFSLENKSIKTFLVSSIDLAGQELLKVLETIPQHACELETSLMLFLKPETVQMEKVVEEYPSGPRFLVSPSGRDWMKTGVMGDPRKASAEKGEKIFNLMTKRLKEILTDIAKD
ncbi:MAG: creatininase family protein [Candidatus Jordarchaeum sp.]|uniref:creatininase family protein n=1 Tax=Candidatus Jordarchaeum sp. TaxID=2823881 RepID=UPI00404B0FF8